MTIRVVDIETTGDAPPEHGVVEIASADLDHEAGKLLRRRSELVFPGRPIPPETRAIHHISDADVAHSKRLPEVVPGVLLHLPDPIAFAAHNAKFEMQWLAEFTGLVPWICTYKTALRLWPGSPNHKNQTLRYFLNLEIPDKAPTQPVHRALPDAVVTAYILREALKHAGVDQMIAWTKEPPLMPRCPIGKFRNKPWAEVEDGFLHWMLKQADMDADLKWNAQQEINLRVMPREPEPPSPTIVVSLPGTATGLQVPLDDTTPCERYIEVCKHVIPTALSIDDLGKWWVEESAHREEHGIVKGNPHYNDLAQACADHKNKLLEKSEV